MDKIWLKVMNICRFTCHQKPSRSFYINDFQLPVCARCTGIYVGYILALILLFIFRVHIRLFLIFILFVPCALDGLIQLKSSYESTNLKRFITGILCGIAYIYSFAYIVNLFI